MLVGLDVVASMRLVVAVGALAVALLAGCGRSVQHAGKTTFDPGQAGFQAYCAACHQYDGKGVGEAPPFEGSPWVTGPEERLIKIVLHGVRGAMVIDGKTYNREMPGFGQILTDEEVAVLLSYVRRRFGGPSGSITAENVRRVREENAGRTDYWSVEELLQSP